MDLFCFGDFELVFVGVPTFVGVLGGLCNLFFAFLTLLGSLLDTIATIVQPKFFLCLWHFVGLSELSEYLRNLTKSSFQFVEMLVENSSSLFFQISCSQGILNSSSLSCYLLLRLLAYMYLSQLMRTFTNYLKCIVISS